MSIMSTNGLRFARLFLLAAGLFAALCSAAYANCASEQKGTEVFADTFADDTGGWGDGDGIAYGKGGLDLALYDYSSWTFMNNTFNATDGDYCMEAVMPKAVAPDNNASIGVIALYKDDKDLMEFQIDSKNNITLWRRVDGTWSTVETLTQPSLAPAPGSVVTMRLKVNGTLITPYLNGTELKKIRVQVPPGPLKFGIYMELSKKLPKPGAPFHFNKYRVTTGG